MIDDDATVQQGHNSVTGDSVLQASLERILVFGSSGLIGRELCGLLQRSQTCEVIGYSAADCNLLDSSNLYPALARCNENTSVVFCSAITRNLSDSWDVFLKNITMTHNFLSIEATKRLRSVVFLSSVDVYGLPPHELPITENTLPRPTGYYALSKLCSEQLFAVELQGSCPVCVLRVPGVFGYRDEGRSVVGRLLRQVIRGETVQLSGSGSTRRDYVDVEDLCRVIEWFIQRPLSGVVNVATGKSNSIQEIVSLIGAASDREPIVEHSAHSGQREHDLEFDTTYLRSRCDIQFKSLQKAIQGYASKVGGDFR